jgi:hypothetical protein
MNRYFERYIPMYAAWGTLMIWAMYMGETIIVSICAAFITLHILWCGIRNEWEKYMRANPRPKHE